MDESSFDRGVFEGQVITQLINIEKKIDGLVLGTVALEARVMVLTAENERLKKEIEAAKPKPEAKK